jgi:hypothetical protein
MIVDTERVEYQVINTLDGLAGIKHEWDRLVASSDSFHPSVFPGAAMSWLSNFGEAQGDKLHILAFWDAKSHLRGVIPWAEVSYGWKKISLIQTLRPVGRVTQKRPMVMEIRPGPIIETGWEPKVAAALLRIIDNNRRHTFMDLSGAVLNLFGNEWVDNENRKRAYENTVFYFPMPANHEEIEARFSRNMRKSLRQRDHKLGRKGVRLDLSIYEKPHQVIHRLNDFFRLHKARATMGKGPKHQDYYPTMAHQNYLLELAQTLPPGVMRLAAGTIGGEIHAARIIFVFNDWLYLYDTGFNPEYRHEGIMQSLNVALVKEFLGEPNIKKVSLSVGWDDNKGRWKPEELPFYRYRFVPPHPHTQRLYRLFQMLESLKSRSIKQS